MQIEIEQLDALQDGDTLRCRVGTNTAAAIVGKPNGCAFNLSFSGTPLKLLRQLDNLGNASCTHRVPFTQ